MRNPMTREQTDRLRKFRDENGRTWKSKLRALWMNGRDTDEVDGHLLRQIRNRHFSVWFDVIDLEPEPWRQGGAAVEQFHLTLLKKSIDDLGRVERLVSSREAMDGKTNDEMADMIEAGDALAAAKDKAAIALKLVENINLGLGV